jgi:hypothetical protein
MKEKKGDERKKGELTRWWKTEVLLAKDGSVQGEIPGEDETRGIAQIISGCSVLCDLPCHKHSEKALLVHQPYIGDCSE